MHATGRTVLAIAAILIAAVAVNVGLAARDNHSMNKAAAAALVAPNPQRQESNVVSARQRANLTRSAVRIGAARQATWKCEDALGAPRSKAATDVWSLPRSIPYRTWAARKWSAAAASCAKRLQLRTIPATNDWQTAVALVQRIYPGTSSWLLYISHREGGHGGFVMNHQGSGAGGWMQFMASTYYAYNDAAYADARRRGFIIGSATNSWTHPLGQAITAGYMRFVGLDGCHWCL